MSGWRWEDEQANILMERFFAIIREELDLGEDYCEVDDEEGFASGIDFTEVGDPSSMDLNEAIAEVEAMALDEAMAYTARVKGELDAEYRESKYVLI